MTRRRPVPEAGRRRSSGQDTRLEALARTTLLPGPLAPQIQLRSPDAAFAARAVLSERNLARCSELPQRARRDPKVGGCLLGVYPTVVNGGWQMLEERWRQLHGESSKCGVVHCVN